MSLNLVALGLGLAAIGYMGKYIIKRLPGTASKFSEAVKKIPGIDANSKYYKGGFDSTMNKREACLILGVSPSASSQQIKLAHRKVMLLNHPDKGGSPYLAAKINEAKDFMERNKN